MSQFNAHTVTREGDIFSHRLGRPLKPWFNGDHLQVEIKRRIYYVHHLVLEEFVGPRLPGMKGLHRDDDPWHNHVDNLYWGTSSQNALDRVKNGRDFNANKTECLRGHQLAGANIAPWSIFPNRVCLSCNRTHGLRRTLTEEEFQAISDLKYAELMCLK